ncbi:MAG TPA: PfkB family carbohydrate kinase [Micromonosporaceae bacterium]|nr:PfkB family carbohydrate kinase [Micromonosporaceae bacterium]
MTARFFVLGPIAWDTVLAVPRLPAPGGFVQADCATERPGGAGANVAVALAGAGASVHMIGYVGRDAYGNRLLADLRVAGVDVGHVVRRGGPTSHVIILVVPSGERTMVGVRADRLAEVSVPVGAPAAGDIVYVAGWRSAFAPALAGLLDRGVTVVSVPADGPPPPATYVVGSEGQLAGIDPGQDPAYRRVLAGPTRAVVVTRGADGCRVYRAGSRVDVPAHAVSAVDATGAGDAFAAGLLLFLGRGADLDRAVRAGTAWAAHAVTVAQSRPPAWSQVAAAVTRAVE